MTNISKVTFMPEVRGTYVFTLPVFETICPSGFTTPYMGMEEKEGKKEEETGTFLSNSAFSAG